MDHWCDHRRELSDLDHRRRVGDGENWSNPGHPLMVEPIGFADGRDVGEGVGTRREEHDCRVFGLSQEVGVPPIERG